MKKIYVFLFVMSLLLGCFVLLRSYDLLRIVHGSRAWPTVYGEVVESTVIKHEIPGSMKRGPLMGYGPHVKYGYWVENNYYYSDKIGLTDFIGKVSTNDIAFAERIVAQYAVGMNVKVYYDPMHPEKAVIDKKLSKGLYVPVFAGIVFLVIGLVGLTRQAFFVGICKA